MSCRREGGRSGYRLRGHVPGPAKAPLREPAFENLLARCFPIHDLPIALGTDHPTLPRGTIRRSTTPKHQSALSSFISLLQGSAVGLSTDKARAVCPTTQALGARGLIPSSTFVTKPGTSLLVHYYCRRTRVCLPSPHVPVNQQPPTSKSGRR